MYKGLIEINPGYVSWYKMSLSSTKLEILASKQIKINKKLNFFENDRYILQIITLIKLAKEELQKEGCLTISIIAVGNFAPLILAKLKESFYILYLDNSRWKYYASKKFRDKTLYFWFEKGYAKVGWIKNGTVFVNDLYTDNSKIEKDKIIESLEENAKKLVFYAFPEDIEYIKIGGMFGIESESFISLVILNISRIFQYSKISYDLKSFIEIVTGKIVK